MADIFLSYAREDKEAAQRLADALSSSGYDVWWDPDIPAGPSFTQVIEEALASAKCVVVLWSGASVRSGWVQDEAREGQERNDDAAWERRLNAEDGSRRGISHPTTIFPCVAVR